jgi:cytoskeletal protein RodZ
MHRISRAFPLSRLVAVCLISLLAGPLPLAATAQQAPAQPLPNAPAPANGAAQNQQDSHAPSLRLVSGARAGTDAGSSASVAQSETAMAQPPADAALEGWSSSLAQQAPSAQDADQQQQSQPQKPVGTAVGPVTRPAGIAGARPAGAAIAAAKQRRVHALFIRVAIIVAALGATGAVIGLSQQSPSRPQ